MNAFRLKQFLQTLMNAFQLGLIENPTSHARLICNHYQTKTHLLELAKRRSNAGKQRNLLWLRGIFTLFDDRAIPVQRDEPALFRFKSSAIHGSSQTRHIYYTG